MANVLINDTYLKAIGEAIRSKLRTVLKYKPSEMAEAISSIVGGDTAVVVNSDSAWKYNITQK